MNFPLSLQSGTWVCRWVCVLCEFVVLQVSFSPIRYPMGLLLVWGRNSNAKSRSLQWRHRSLEEPSECITLSYICEFEFMWICSLRSGTLWVCWWVCVYVNLCSVLGLLVFSLGFLWGTRALDTQVPHGFFIHTSLATSSNSSLLDSSSFSELES